MRPTKSKSDLINAVAADLSISKRQAKGNVEAVLNSIRDLSEDGLQIRYFGRFHMRDVKAVSIKTPAGGLVDVPATRRMAFKVSKQLG